MMNNKVLIIGGSGQLGFYLTKYLIKRKLNVFISTRKTKSKKLNKFNKLQTNKKIKFILLNIYKKKKISYQLKKIKPDYIFFLAGQSSVFSSFKKQRETVRSNYIGCKNILDSIIKLEIKPKFFNASSTEIFGNNKNKINIFSKKKPVSPYGISKLKSFNIVRNYRKKYNLELYNGILSNCESYIRPKNFVFPKICLSAIQAKKDLLKNKLRKFEFGNINIVRDWGWAEEYVKFIWHKMSKKKYDFIVATGKSYYLQYLIKLVYEKLNLNWKNHIIINKKFFRKKEIYSVKIDMKKNKKIIKTDAKKVILKLLKFYKKKN